MNGLSDEALWKLYQEHNQNATLVARYLGMSGSHIRDRIVRIKKNLAIVEPESSAAHLADLLEKSNTPSELIEKGKLRKLVVGTHPFSYKNAEGEGVTEGLFTKRATFEFDTLKDTPAFPLIQPASPTSFVYSERGPYIMRKVRRHIIVSDAQIGRIWRDGVMVETHDPTALEVTEQITADVQPDELDYVGDWMDWSMLSRWPKKPEYVSTTQQGIQDGYDWHGRLIVAAGPRCKRKRKAKGNHDDRPAIFLRELNLEAMGLRRASDTTGWPVFSTEFLLRYDELGIEVSDPYPNGTIWLTDDLVIMHAPPKKLEMAASVIHGHTHKLTRETWAQTSSTGRLTFFRYDIGCVCKIDGSVPSDRPRTDWAQGIALVEILDGKLPIHRVEQIHIDNGRSLFEGRLYEAKSLSVAA